MRDDIVIAHGMPYEQMGMLRRLWYRLRWKPMTLETIDFSINRHSVCIGVSGLGKSRLLVQYAKAVIARGWNLVVFDVSDSWRQILWYCIVHGIDPARVVILDATRDDIAVPKFNVLAVPEGSSQSAVVDGFLAAWRGFLGDGFGERQADVLRMLAFTLIKADVALMPWSVRFLMEEDVRKRVLGRAKDKELDAFWAAMESMSGYASIIESSRNKLNAMRMNSHISRYFDSRTSSFDLYEEFKQGGKIIFLNLSENFYKDRSSLGFLGSSFLFLIYQAILRRENDREDERPPVVLCLDESQLYHSTPFVVPVFTGGRKWNAAISIFSQSTNNYPPDDLDIMLATCGQLISFGVSHKDAQRLVMDLVMPKDVDMLMDSNGYDWLVGMHNEPKYWGIAQQREHAIAELTNQGRRELMWRVRSADRIDLYLARVANVEDYDVPRDVEDAYRRECARLHCGAE
jgi:hypothetical protein